MAEGENRANPSERNTMTQLAFESATNLVQKIKSGELTSVGLLEHYLARVDSHNSELNAVIVQIRERAMALTGATTSRPKTH